MSLDSILAALAGRLRGAPEALRERILKGLSRSVYRDDLTMVYHYISMISEDYHGVDLPYEAEDFYKTYKGKPSIALPEPHAKAGVDILEVIKSRRSRRRYSRRPLSLGEVATLLYYTVGVVGRTWWGGPKRVYPSAGALQPVEAYLSASRVNGLEEGLYHYNPGKHSLELLKKGDYSLELARIALGQEHVGEAPACIILTIVYRRTASKYGLRSYKYSHLDAGFASQNIYLVAEALNLATVAVGAYYDEELCKLLEIDCEEEMPALMFPIGGRT